MLKSRFRLPTKRSLLDFALVFGGTAFATGAGFLLKVLIGRGLGDSALGLFGMGYATLVVVSTLADMGIRYSLITLASRTLQDDLEKARAFVAAGLLLKLAAGVAVLGLGWLLAPWAAEALFRKPEVTPYLQIASFGILLWGLWDGVEGALQSSQRFKDGAALKMVMEAARVTSFLALWLYKDGVLLTMDRFMWLYFLCPALAVAGGAWLLQASLQPRADHLAERTRELLSFAPGVFFYRSCTMVLLFLDSLMLTRYGELGTVGQFEAAKGLAYAVLLVSETLGMVLLPKVTQLKTVEALKDMLRRFAVYFAAVAVAATVWLLGAGALLGLFGKAFTAPEVVQAFQILVVATLFTIPATTMGMVLLGLDRPSVLGKVAAVQVVLGVLAYPVTCVQWGLLGTAATTAVLQLLGAVALLAVLRREIARR